MLSPEPQERSLLESVAQLEKRVTLSETRIPLGELVEKVAAETGAPLRAAPCVTYEPVVVVVRDFPAHKLLSEVAALLGYRWDHRPGGEGVGHYEVWQDEASKEREEALRRDTAAEVEERFRRQVGLLIEVAHMPPQQIEALLDEWDEHWYGRDLSPEAKERVTRSMMAKMLRPPLMRALASLLGGLTAEQWAALREEAPLVFSTNPMPGELGLPAETAHVLRESRPDIGEEDGSWMACWIAPTPMTPSRPDIGEEDDPQPEAEDEWDEWAEVKRNDQNQASETLAQWMAAAGHRVTIKMTSSVSTGGSLALRVEARPIDQHEFWGFRRGRGFITPFSFHITTYGTYLDLSAHPVELERQRAQDTPQRRAALRHDPILGVQKLFKPQVKRSGDEDAPEEAEQDEVIDLDTCSVTVTAWLPDVARTYGVQIISDAYQNAISGTFSTSTGEFLTTVRTALAWAVILPALTER